MIFLLLLLHYISSKVWFILFTFKPKLTLCFIIWIKCHLNTTHNLLAKSPWFFLKDKFRLHLQDWKQFKNSERKQRNKLYKQTTVSQESWHARTQTATLYTDHSSDSYTQNTTPTTSTCVITREKPSSAGKKMDRGRQKKKHPPGTTRLWMRYIEAQPVTAHIPLKWQQPTRNTRDMISELCTFVRHQAWPQGKREVWFVHPETTDNTLNWNMQPKHWVGSIGDLSLG